MKNELECLRGAQNGPRGATIKGGTSKFSLVYLRPFLTSLQF